MFFLSLMEATFAGPPSVPPVGRASGPINILDTFDAVSFENLDDIDAKDLVILEATSTKNSATQERVVSNFFDDAFLEIS